MIRISNKNKAVIYIIISAFCFALMNLCVRLSGDLPSFQKSFFRNFVAMFFAAAMMLKNKQGFRWKKGNFKYLFLRSLAGTVGIVCNFYAVDHIPLSDASILNKMSPFFVIIFSIIILKEKLSLFQGTVVFAAFVGALFVIKPSFSNVDLFPSMLGLMGGMFAGFAYTIVRLLGKRNENGAMIVFFFSAFSCLTMLPFLIFDFHPMNIYQFLMLLCAGLAASGGQFSITAAYCNAPAREISVYDYSQIIFATILGFVFFGELTDIYSFIGYAIIILMAAAMFMYNNKIWIFKNKKN